MNPPPAMRFQVEKAMVLLGVSVMLGGCSVITGWFPDKQKQYRYSTEIPPLEIPPELTSSTIDGAAPRPRPPAGDAGIGETAAPTEGQGAEAPPSEGQSQAESEPPRTAPKRSRSEPVPTLAQSSDDVPLIEIEAPYEVAWAEVAKALGRLELEISDQNRSDGVYYVYYGGDAKPYEDRGFFGDVAEMFGKGVEQSKEYRIKLEEKGQATFVYILNADNQPQNSGPGLDLLKRLHETLQSMRRSGKAEASSANTQAAPENTQ